MLKIHGPTYRYSGEKLDSPRLIYVQDHHYDPEHGHALAQLLDNSCCPADQHLLVFDHVNIQDEFGEYPHVCLPLLLAAETKEFNEQTIVPVWSHRTHAFNFIINKPRINRQILLEMVVGLSLDSYRHSLCWQQGYGSVPPTDYMFGDEVRLDQGVLNGPHKNSQTYQHLLKSKVFEPSCVSLITEPAYHEKETIVTEKTLMAIWSGTIPIWVGGWRCADFMRESGFDVFDDIVDHRYQCLSDPEQRCRRAIADNLDLLKRPMDMTVFNDRLQHNLSLLKSNVFWRQIQTKTQDHPELMSLVAEFRSGCLVSYSG